jgi:pimeloyl-ACP methyl ester carboxylesterase
MVEVTVDILPPKHTIVERDGTRLHVARLKAERPEAGGRGSSDGRTLLFLHGWPEFWWTWSPLMERLSARGYDCVAPDLRGFGDSDNGPGRSAEVGAEVHAADALAIMDALKLDRVGIVSHDVGAYVAQGLARATPERLAGLFFFDCPYPGIGARGGAPDMLKEIWYQSFNQLPLAVELVGGSRDSIRAYFGTMLRHWAAGNPAAFDDATVERFVDNFAKPGNLQGGFNWYISQAEARLRMLRGEAPTLPPIAVPTCVRWGERDPILRVDWADKLGETFADLDSAPFPGVGHFPHREDPDRAADEIDRFFKLHPPA